MSEQKQHRLSKEEFAKMMNEKRQSLFNMANEQVEKAVESADNFLTYLNLKSQLDYTVTNTLLVMAQNPNATQLKDISHWREDNKYIRKGQKGIQILEPGEYTRKDGSVGISYNPKFVFDISQLQGKNNHIHAPEYSTKEILSALIYKKDILPEIIEQDTKSFERVYFDPESQKILVKDGLDPKVMINGIIREYCMIEYMDMGATREEASFQAECSAYMISRRYGIGDYNTMFISSSNEHFFSMNPKEIKQELENISRVTDSVSTNIKYGLYAQQEQTKQKEAGEHER